MFEKITKQRFTQQYPEKAQEIEQLRQLAPHVGYYVMLMDDQILLYAEAMQAATTLAWNERAGMELKNRLLKSAKVLRDLHSSRYRNLMEPAKRVGCQLQLGDFFVTMKAPDTDGVVVYNYDVLDWRCCAADLSRRTAIQG